MHAYNKLELMIVCPLNTSPGLAATVSFKPALRPARPGGSLARQVVSVARRYCRASPSCPELPSLCFRFC